MKAPWLWLIVLSGCAAPSVELRKQDAQLARVYALPEARAQQLVREVLEKRGLDVLPTEDPHTLMTPTRHLVTTHRSVNVPDDGSSDQLEVADHRLLTEDQTWMVHFEAVGPNATAIRVVRGEQYAWANAAERSTTMVGPPMVAVRTDPNVTPVFLRDHEEEAAIAAELDAQVAVEVSEAGGRRVERVEPLADPSPAAEPLEAGACRIPAAQLEPLLAAGHLILLGDPIGAQEPWAVVDDLLCLAMERQLPVTLAVSLPGAEQARLNRFLASRGAPEDRQALLAGPFWNRDWQDGRSSLATVDALERLRQLRASGAPITVLAVDTGLSGNPRQASIASTILAHRVAHPERLLVGLLGNVLVSRHQGAEWDRDLLPVGARLASVLPEHTHSLDFSFQRGSHWTCHLAEKGRLLCGTWALEPSPAQRSHASTPRPYVQLFSGTSDQGFDGVYFAGGELTPSIPAVARLRADEGTRTLRKDRPPSWNDAAELGDSQAPGPRRW